MLLIGVGVVINVCGQEELKISKLDNSRLIYVLNNSKLITENREEWISVKVYTMDNGSGSAGLESCERSDNLLVAVSEFDEAPLQNLFEVGPFLSPKFMRWRGEKEYEKEFEIEYGALDQRQNIVLKVSIDTLELVK